MVNPKGVGKLLPAVQNTLLMHVFDNVRAADLLILEINYPARQILSRSKQTRRPDVCVIQRRSFKPSAGTGR